MSDYDDLVAALAPVSAALTKLGVRHYVGGSVASSFHGATRSTMDVDLVAELTDSQVPEFIRSCGAEFYVSESAVRDAIRRKSCFNLIHLPTAFKVDVFISRKRPFDNSAMDRASLEALGNVDGLKICIASPEDAIISKLEWYQMTNETSDRQWSDVTRLLKLLGDAADIGYLRASAESVGVQKLLDRLLAEAVR